MREPRRRSRLWWYRRLRRAYRIHGAHRTRRQAWEDAEIAHRGVPAIEQRALKPIK